MPHRHVTRQLLHAVLEGRRQSSDLADLAMAHLLDLCPVCNREFEAWKEECSRIAPANYSAAFERAVALAREATGRVAEERCDAGVKLGELLALPPQRRLEAVREAPQEYRGPALVQLLLEESMGNMPGRPRDALALAQLARAVLQHEDLSGIVIELYARSVAYVANAKRICGNLPEASEMFDHARFILRSEGGGDHLVRAELDWLEGVLRKDQRRFHEAEGLLTSAAHSYQFAGVRLGAARALISLGILYRLLGVPTRGAQTAEQALEILQGVERPDLVLAARHNIALCLVDGAQYEEARAALSETAPLVDRYGDELGRLRVAWTEGLISQGLGEQAAAESSFLAAKHGFVKHAIAFDAALVSLDLAGLYLQEGRSAEVKQIAQEVVGVFEEQEVHREALAAMLLFRDAALLEQVSLQLVQRLVSYLRAAKHDPALAFEEAS